MRFLLSTALALVLPSVASAEDILARGDIASATVYAQGAEVVRLVRVDLPAGQHRLIIPMRDLEGGELPDVTGPDGMRVGVPQVLRAVSIPEGSLDTAAEAEARAAAETAKGALQAAEDQLAVRDAEIDGIEAQLTYLTLLSRGGQDGAAMPEDPAVLTQLLSTLGAETVRAGAELQAAQADRRALEEAVSDRREELEIANRALAELRPFGPDATAIAVDVDMPEAGSAEFEITYFTFESAWHTSYVLDLSSETGTLEVERLIHFTHLGPAPWRDVQMQFSTANPSRQSTPSDVYPAPARIMPPMPVAPAASLRGGVMEMAVDDMAMEPVIIAEDASAVLQTNGLSLVYAYQQPVTLGPDGMVTLPFDTLSLEMELENRAVPRRDQTAFLWAMGENESGEPILPGEARLYRDGDLIGGTYLPLIASGADMDMGFGPLDHLQLTWQDLSRDESDRGIFVTSDEQSRSVAFSVVNTSDSAETVRLLYATPFSEQEDLEVNVTLSRAPDEQDVDDKRGVVAWDLEVAPGTEQGIQMNVDLSWPEDQVLNWQP